MLQRPVLVVLGAGASGFFSAIHAAESYPHAQVIILEKSNKMLAKVRISGGGRCNVTHYCLDPKLLVANYPRGGKALLSVFTRFDVQDTIRFFRSKGVELKTEQDNRMFPASNDSASIVNCFIEQARQLKIIVRCGFQLQNIEKQEKGFILHGINERVFAHRLILATGGNIDDVVKRFLKSSGHIFNTSIPSLFTFNLVPHPLKERMGVSVNPVSIQIAGYKQKFEGPLLITHWGLSGPAILKASAFMARELNACNYRFGVWVDWLPMQPYEEILSMMENYVNHHKQKTIGNCPPEGISSKLWQSLLLKWMVNPEKTWAVISVKDIRILTEQIKKDGYSASGKTTFKEEFVTCGGIDLKSIDLKTMQSKLVKGLFFCGELTDVDGITGGFNFQYAWSSGYLAGTNSFSL